MGDTVAQIHPELHVLTQPMPFGPSEGLADKIRGFSRLFFTIAPNLNRSIGIEFAPLTMALLNNGDRQTIPCGYEK
jgi:hypothetical protein